MQTSDFAQPSDFVIKANDVTDLLIWLNERFHDNPKSMMALLFALQEVYKQMPRRPGVDTSLVPLVQHFERGQFVTPLHPDARVQRRCTLCNLNGAEAMAEYVATSNTGLQWFECEDHGPTDHPDEQERIKRQPLQEWLAKEVLGGSQSAGEPRG